MKTARESLFLRFGTPRKSVRKRSDSYVVQGKEFRFDRTERI